MGDEKQEQPEWGTARIVESNEEAIVVAGFLKSNGIPAEVESLHVEELPVNVGGLGEVRVRVPADRLNEALSLLEATDREEPAGDSGDSDDAAEASPGDRAE